jgi:hypothetical protein
MQDGLPTVDGRADSSPNGFSPPSFSGPFSSLFFAHLSHIPNIPVLPRSYGYRVTFFTATISTTLPIIMTGWNKLKRHHR